MEMGLTRVFPYGSGPALAGPLMTFLEDAAIKGGDPDDELQVQPPTQMDTEKHGMQS